MNKKERSAYRRGLNIGEAVYFVEGEDNLGSSDQPLVVKKGMVEGAVFSNGEEQNLRVPTGFIEGGGVISTSRPVSEVFTRREVVSIIANDPSALIGDIRSVDEIVEDVVSNRLLVGALGGVIFRRTSNDFLKES
jgi:hypothetical protein